MQVVLGSISKLVKHKSMVQPENEQVSLVPSWFLSSPCLKFLSWLSLMIDYSRKYKYKLLFPPGTFGQDLIIATKQQTETTD